MKYILLVFIALLQLNFGYSQGKTIPSFTYTAKLNRIDSLQINFTIVKRSLGRKLVWEIVNATEHIKVDQIQIKGDSVFVEMPFFEASFLLKKSSAGYEGIWKKATATGFTSMPLLIERGSRRINLPISNVNKNISGTWEVNFVEQDNSISKAVAQFKQQGRSITGTIMTPTGDYRYLDGVISGDSIVLSTFDGSHAFLFTAKVDQDGKLLNGIFASGLTFKQHWNAIRNPMATFSEDAAKMKPIKALSGLSFRFPDLDSNLVSIKDNRFKGKVVIVQIMGSWCPNCMDETAFLSKFYDEYKNRGVEVIGLAYEYSLDFQRSRKSLMKFHDRFQVKYPILITGVTTSDPLRTEKTLPEMSPIKAFPSMIILGKDGTIRKTHAGYTGPATGEHYVKFKQEFTSLIDKLLSEK